METSASCEARYAPLLYPTNQVPSGLSNKLQGQSSRKLDFRQGCHEIAEKSSKIVPLGAPLSQIKTRFSENRNVGSNSRATSLLPSPSLIVP